MAAKLFRSSGFEWLEPCFDELETVVDDFVRNEEEPPFWFNEAASVSLIVSAASRIGWIALTDYSRTKHSNANSPSKVKNGRCDLYLRSSPARILEVEAKQIWFGLNSLKSLKKSLTDACKDAKSLRGGEKIEKAGMVFAVLSLTKEQNGDDYKASITKFEDKLLNSKAPLVWLWSASPQSNRDKYRYKSKVGERYYPALGVLVSS